MKKLLLGLAFLSTTALAMPAHRYKNFQLSTETASSVMSARTPDIMAEATGQYATALFVDLKNNGNETHTVGAATSPMAQIVQLHSTVMRHGDKNYMIQVKSIAIKPHHDRDLHAGGFHVMLINTTKQLVKGDMVPVTLIFADGSWMTIHANVS